VAGADACLLTPACLLLPLPAAAFAPLPTQAGSDPDELHPTEGFAPLHAAVSSEASRTEVIRLLLVAGADVNLLRSANPIWSPLMYAATRGSLEHLQLLLGELGASQLLHMPPLQRLPAFLVLLLANLSKF
jgi:ankyrin repeat protein